MWGSQAFEAVLEVSTRANYIVQKSCNESRWVVASEEHRDATSHLICQLRLGWVTAGETARRNHPAPTL